MRLGVAVVAALPGAVLDAGDLVDVLMAELHPTNPVSLDEARTPAVDIDG